MDHGALVLIEIGALILGIGLLSRLAAWMGISPIPLILLGGLAFGEGGLFPFSAGEEFIEIGAEIGVILLLLMLGLEYTAQELVGNLKGSRTAGLIDMAAQRRAGRADRASAGLGAGRRGGHGGHHVGVVLRRHRQGAAGSRPPHQPRDARGPFHPRHRGLRDGVLSAGADRAPDRTSLLAGTLSVVIALAGRAADPVHRAAARTDRVAARLVEGGRRAAAVGARPRAAGLRPRRRSERLVGGGSVPGRHRDLRARGQARAAGAHARCATCSRRCSSCSSASPPTRGTSSRCSCPPILLAIVGMGTKLLTGYLAARRAGIAEAGRWRAGFALMPRGEFSIVIAGLAVAAGVDRIAGRARDRLRADHDDRRPAPGPHPGLRPVQGGDQPDPGEPARPPGCVTVIPRLQPGSVQVAGGFYGIVQPDLEELIQVLTRSLFVDRLEVLARGGRVVEPLEPQPRAAKNASSPTSTRSACRVPAPRS